MNDPTKTNKTTKVLNQDHQIGIAWFAAGLQAWIANKMEITKQMVGLSALAIGLLFAFHNNLVDALDFIIWLIAAIFFTSCIFLGLKTYEENSNYLHEILGEFQRGELKKTGESGEKSRSDSLADSLQKKEGNLKLIFILGVVSLSGLAIKLSGFIL